MMRSLARRAAKFARLVRPFVTRELRDRYADSALGVVWNLLKPALQILIYWWLLRVVFRLEVSSPYADDRNTPFFFYLLSGLVPWLGILEAVERGSNAVLDHRGMVSKIRFSLWVFPVSAVAAVALAYSVVYTLAIALYLILDGGVLTAGYPYLVVAALGAVFFATGMALIFSSLSVYLRDLPHLLSLLMMILFYSAPVLYSVSLVPEDIRPFLVLNPYFSIVEILHHAVIWRVPPPPELLVVGLLYPAVLLGIGIYMFRRLQPGFSDVL